MSTDPIDFDRPIPLFPLPNVVLFPGVVQPLHIFEERYRTMMADTLADQSLIAMALLKTGWEKDYYGTPALHSTLCLGKIVAHEKVEDGKFNLLLQGLLRTRIRSESRHGLYRIAILAPILDPPPDARADAAHRRTLTALFTHGPLAAAPLAESIRDLLARTPVTPTMRLVDVIAFSFLQDVAAKQRLLEQPDPNVRAQDLIAQLVTLARAKSGDGTAQEGTPWPPPLNTN